MTKWQNDKMAKWQNGKYTQTNSECQTFVKWDTLFFYVLWVEVVCREFGVLNAQRCKWLVVVILLHALSGIQERHSLQSEGFWVDHMYLGGGGKEGGCGWGGEKKVEEKKEVKTKITISLFLLCKFVHFDLSLVLNSLLYLFGRLIILEFCWFICSLSLLHREHCVSW